MSALRIDDAASAVLAALSVPAGVYNVTDNVPMPRREAFNLLADTLGVRHPRMLPRWAGRILGSLGDTIGRSQRISNAKFRQVSSWVPAVPSLREGWTRLVKELAG
jgi:nucleoside-diphosphate-sugar epimerase